MNTYHPITILFSARKNRINFRECDIYCCIKIKGQNSKEICIEKGIKKQDWDAKKGRPKQQSDYLIKFGIYLKSIKFKLLSIYLDLKLQDVAVTVERIKNIYLGKDSSGMTLLPLMDKAIEKYRRELSPGTMKNYGATKFYIEAFCKQQFRSGDIPLKLLTYSFLDKLKTYILTTPIKSNDPCTTNGCMKHIERIKKIIKWAYEIEYIERNVFATFKIRKKRYESKVLTWSQIRLLEEKKFSDRMLELVRDLFLFSCYTGIAPTDLQNLKPHQIYSDSNQVTWMKYVRGKSIITANVPLLIPAIELLNKHALSKSATAQQTCFPKVTNQELNKGLKMIAEICELGMPLNFYMARHTFATTVTLEQGVPITTIKEMMGHEKIESTMNYAKTNKSTIATDMFFLSGKLPITAQ
jgi:integrase/recombinase XerD